MEIRIKTGGPIKDISVANSYAPHSGYSVEAIAAYWDW